MIPLPRTSICTGWGNQSINSWKVSSLIFFIIIRINMIIKIEYHFYSFVYGKKLICVSITMLQKCPCKKRDKETTVVTHILNMWPVRQPLNWTFPMHPCPQLIWAPWVGFICLNLVLWSAPAGTSQASFVIPILILKQSYIFPPPFMQSSMSTRLVTCGCTKTGRRIENIANNFILVSWFQASMTVGNITFVFKTEYIQRVLCHNKEYHYHYCQ